MTPYLTKNELIAELRRRAGLIPVDLDIERRRLIWQDLEQYHSYEGFFSASLNTFGNLKRYGNNNLQPVVFESDLDLLESDQILTDFIYPTGFIFHASRCGSTLLSKALARSRSNLVFGEADLHNRIWSALTNGWSAPPAIDGRNQTIYKNLILAMGRRRLESHAQHFIKFTSFNILFFELIKAAFPDVPAIFIYRDPDAIIGSLRDRSPGWLNDTPITEFIADVERYGYRDLTKSDPIENALARFFSAAADAGRSGVKFLHYPELIPINLPIVLNALKAVISPDDLLLMQNQFRYDSKEEYKLHNFEAKVITETGKSIGSSRPLKDLYSILLKSDRNLIESEALISN